MMSKLQAKYPVAAVAPFEEMLFPLSTLFEVASTTTIVLDGLDEVEEGAPELEQLLDFLKTTSEQTSVRVNTASLQLLLSSPPSFLVGADDTMQGILQFVRARTTFSNTWIPAPN
jgi:hypothetical protein